MLDPLVIYTPLDVTTEAIGFPLYIVETVERVEGIETGRLELSTFDPTTSRFGTNVLPIVR